MSPHDIQRHLNMGEALLEMGQTERAISLIQQLLAEEPEQPRAMGLLARALIEAERHREALEVANSLVALEPHDEWGHRLCSIALDGVGLAQEALRAARNAVQRAPLSWRTHQARAVSALSAGHQAEALAAAKQAVHLAPNEPECHAALGLVAAEKGDQKTARGAYAQALSLDPEHASSLNNMAVLDGRRRLAPLAPLAHLLADALRIAPADRVLQANVEWLATRFARRVLLASLFALSAALATSLARPEHRFAVDPLTIAVGVLLLAGVVSYTLRLATTVPLGIRRHALSRMWRSPALAFNVTCAVVVCAAALTLCFVPGYRDLGLGIARLLLTTIGVVAIVQSRRTAVRPPD